MKQRTQRDIQRDAAENRLRQCIIEIYANYKELDVTDVIYILGSQTKFETIMLTKHYNIVSKTEGDKK